MSEVSFTAGSPERNKRREKTAHVTYTRTCHFSNGARITPQESWPPFRRKIWPLKRARNIHIRQIKGVCALEIRHRVSQRVGRYSSKNYDATREKERERWTIYRLLFFLSLALCALYIAIFSPLRFDVCDWVCGRGCDLKKQFGDRYTRWFIVECDVYLVLHFRFSPRPPRHNWFYKSNIITPLRDGIIMYLFWWTVDWWSKWVVLHDPSRSIT